MEREKLRGYFFGNAYLSSIQQGLQAGHVIQEMTIKYTDDYIEASKAGDIFKNWCRYHKTIILLNGGMHQNLYEVYSTLLQMTNRGKTYPIALFNEERAALNDAITSVGIVLPERVYNPEMVYTVSAYTNLMDNKIHEYISEFKLAN